MTLGRSAAEADKYTTKTTTTTTTTFRHLGVENKISGLSGYRRRENLGYFPAKQVAGKFRPPNESSVSDSKEIRSLVSFSLPFEGRRHNVILGRASRRLAYGIEASKRGTREITRYIEVSRARGKMEARKLDPRERKLPRQRKIRALLPGHCNFYRYR